MTINTKNTKKILNEYKDKSPLYLEYCQTMSRLLESMLKQGNHKFHLNFRVKDINSLEEKIERKRRKGKIYKKLSEIEDIAGIRIVFYTESDRKDVINSLKKEFGKRIKLEETSKITGYRAMHAVVSLGKNRAGLPEYSRFKGLKCEIQLALMIDHAWAEVEHDILYKEGSKIKTLDKKQYITLKERLEKVMNNYVKKGSKELEEIVTQIKKIKVA